jgi:hypothetical protein
MRMTPARGAEGVSMSRFATTRALFETFPQSVTKLGVAPTDDPPLVFLRNLSGGEKLADAVIFCAYLLPRREAVWWACGNVRAFLDDIPRDRAAPLVAAEAWVRDPDEEHRAAALKIGTDADSNDALTWLALGAGWSGGMLSSNPKAPVPVPHYMTPRAVRIATSLAARFVKPPERDLRMRARIAEGIKLAESGLG